MSIADSRGRLVKASAIAAGIVRTRESAVVTGALLSIWAGRDARVDMRLPLCASQRALGEIVAPVSARPRRHLRGAWAPAFRPPRGGIAQWSANRYKGRLSKLHTRAANDRPSGAGCRR